jgi:hypothetical protein
MYYVLLESVSSSLFKKKTQNTMPEPDSISYLVNGLKIDLEN